MTLPLAPLAAALTLGLLAQVAAPAAHAKTPPPDKRWKLAVVELRLDVAEMKRVNARSPGAFTGQLDKLEAGSERLVLATLENSGDAAHAAYPGVRLVSSHAKVDAGYPDRHFYVIGPRSKESIHAKIAIAADAKAGESVTLTGSVTELNCEAGSKTHPCPPDNPKTLTLKIAPQTADTRKPAPDKGWDLHLSGAKLDVEQMKRENEANPGTWTGDLTRLERGKARLVTVSLDNKGEADHMAYPGVAIASSHAGVDPGPRDHLLYGVPAGQSYDMRWSVQVAKDAKPGKVELTFKLTAIHCEDAKAPGPQCPPPRPLTLELQIAP